MLGGGETAKVYRGGCLKPRPNIREIGISTSLLQPISICTLTRDMATPIK